MCAISSLTSTFAISSPDEFLAIDVPRHNRSTLGRRSYSVAGPIVRNSLQDELRDQGCSDQDAVCVDDSGGPEETPVAYSKTQCAILA